MARIVGKDFKIGLSNKDKSKMAYDITEDVKKQLNYGSPSGVYTTSEILGFEENKGILVSSEDDYWYYWDSKLDKPNKYVKGELFNETASIKGLTERVDALEINDTLIEDKIELVDSNKVDKGMLDWGTMPETIIDKNTFYKEVSKVFSKTTQSIYMFGTPEELQRVWDIWDKPTGLKATHVYIAINSLSNKSNRHAFIMWVFASNYGNPYFRIISGYNGSYTGTDDKGWANVNKLATIEETTASTLDALIDNAYPDEITKEVNQDDLLEIHLDRQFVASLDQETTLAVMRPSSNKQQWTLGGEEVARLKGLRVWIKFAYNGNTLVLSHDIRFPTNRVGYQWYVSTPIPNPAIFSEKIIVQYDTSNDILSLNTTGGSISADTQIIEVKGIK